MAWIASALALVAACGELRTAEPDAGAAADGPDAEGTSVGRDGEGGEETGGPVDGSTDSSKPKPRVAEILASGFTNPLEIVTAGDVVYFTLERDAVASVRRVQKDGGGSAILAPFDAATGYNPLANDLAVIGSEVVWANATAGAGRVFAVPLAGGAVRNVSGLLDTPYHLAAFAGEVYFVDRAFSPAVYGLYRLPLDGAAPVVVAPGQVRVGGIAVDATGVYWSQGGPLATGKSGVRKIAPGAATDASVDLYVGANNGDVGGVALGTSDMVWADTDTGRVMRVGKTGGIATALASSLAAPMRVWLDGSTVYFTEHGLTTAKDGRLSRVPLAGGAVEVLASSQDHPLGVTCDATHVYWTNYGSGEVLRIAK